MSEHNESIIASYIITELLHDDKTVRDPIHGDILWNHLETQVIDTETFQRLRRIKQMGTAHFVFPGIEYSRFQHSLGTLHMAHVLLQNITNNRFSKYRIFGETKLQDMTFRLVVRLAALLHDVHEFPLSHTLEKEGNVFQKQWKDKTLNIKILGKDSEIFKAISGYIVELLNQLNAVQEYINEVGNLDEDAKKVLIGLVDLKDEDKKALAKRFAETITVFTYKLLVDPNSKNSDIAQQLFGDEDFVKDMVDARFLVAGNKIILNTICADLLDYLARDFYFGGIRKMYDERFLKYATITDCSYKKKSYPVFAYRLIGKRQEIKFSVLSSLFDVLELRYTVAELVHTHRTKNAFSVMAIEACNFYYQSLKNEEEKQKFIDKMMHMGDDELLSFLREQNIISKHILDYYFARHPYHEYTLWDFGSIEGNPQLEEALKNHIRNSRERFCLERGLVDKINTCSGISRKLEYGDCLIYMMPHPKTLYKELKTHVIYLDKDGNAKVDTLESLTKTEIPYSPTLPTMRAVIERAKSQRQSLINKYKNLWRTSLFISPDLEHFTLQSIVAELIEKSFWAIDQNVSIAAIKSYIPPDLYEKLSKITQGKRQYKTFEELFKV